MSTRILDPLERTCEILFGIIVVLTFTLSLSLAQGGETETRTVLVAALGCNLAWGIVDAIMYLMAKFTERARDVALFRTVRQARDRGSAAALIHGALPPALAAVLTTEELEGFRLRMNQMPEPTARTTLNGTDFAGAAGVCLLVFSSTIPIAIPFVVMRDPTAALRVSNAIAIGMLFVTGWSLGVYSGRPGWRSGLGMVLVGIVLVAITMALGG